MSFLRKIPKKFLKNFEKNRNLGLLTWFQVGGKSKYFFQPDSVDLLIDFLKHKPDEIEVFALGAGSNILFRDNGFKGIVIHFIKLNKILIDKKGVITADAGAVDADVARFARNNNRSGLEFLIGIPGTVGGGIKMNSGAFDSEFKKVLIDVKTINKNGLVKIFHNEELGLSYRKNNLSDEWMFLSARFKTVECDKEKIQKLMKNIILQRKNNQPTGVKTGGSTFMNMTNHKAWKLIDESGCRGIKHGEAQISEKHCNFIINTNKSSATEIEELGEIVRNKVYKRTGKKLIWEIKIIGEK